jgi:hypothetical protein
MRSNSPSRRTPKGVVQIKDSNDRLQLVYRTGPGPKNRRYLSLGLPNTPDNWAVAEMKAKQMQLDILSGNVISHSNKEGLMRKPPELQDYAGKRAGGEHPDGAMSSKRWSTAFSP